jgi:hypothetical protein
MLIVATTFSLQRSKAGHALRSDQFKRKVNSSSEI